MAPRSGLLIRAVGPDGRQDAGADVGGPAGRGKFEPLKRPGHGQAIVERDDLAAQLATLRAELMRATMVTAALRRELDRLKEALRGRGPQARATLAAIRADRAATLTLAGFDREPRQAALLRSDAARGLILSCRQWGKSTTAAGMAVA